MLYKERAHKLKYQWRFADTVITDHNQAGPSFQVWVSYSLIGVLIQDDFLKSEIEIDLKSISDLNCYLSRNFLRPMIWWQKYSSIIFSFSISNNRMRKEFIRNGTFMNYLVRQKLFCALNSMVWEPEPFRNAPADPLRLGDEGEPDLTGEEYDWLRIVAATSYNSWVRN